MEVTNPKGIKKATIVVGIPSYNESRTIANVVEQVSKGLREYYSDVDSVIVNVDNNSPDKTKEAFLSAKSEVPLIYVTTPEGTKGKGLNFYNLFSLFQELNAEKGLVVDADLTNIEPKWVKKMIEPLDSGYEYVSPLYFRKKDDAYLTNQIIYPLFYGLLGVNIRQPIGGEFSFSSKMVDVWLNQEWTEYIKEFGIDSFMSAHAVLSGAKICQVNLGRKMHKSSLPNLGPMFVQVINTLFRILNEHPDEIKKINEVKEIKTFDDGDVDCKIENSNPDYKAFEEIFNGEYCVVGNKLKKYLSEEIYKEVQDMKEGSETKIDTDLWIKIIYDFLSNFDKNDKEMVEALRCLYFGRITYFFKQIIELTPEETDQKVLRQANKFFDQRDYYLKKFS